MVCVGPVGPTHTTTTATSGRVIRTEKSELEKERVALIQEVMDNKRRMKDLEDNLLLRLTSIEVSLLSGVEYYYLLLRLTLPSS